MNGAPDNTQRVNGDAVMAISDEEIMRYADGVLAAERRAAVRDALARDPILMQTLEGFLLTRGPLARPFDDVLAAPVPARVQSVLQPPPAAAIPPPRRLMDRLLARSRVPMLAVAAFCGVLLGGWLVGFVIHPVAPASDRYEFVTLGAPGLVASPALRRALEQTASGEKVDISEQLSVKPIATLRTRQGTWCREIELLSRKGLRARSLACRAGDGQWLVPVTTVDNKPYGIAGEAPPDATPDTPDHKTPDEMAAIREGAKQIIASEAVTAAKEKSLIEGHWREKD
jgi:hypothetical protein